MRSLVPVLTEEQMINEGVADYLEDIAVAEREAQELVDHIMEAQFEDEARLRKDIVDGYHPGTRERLPLERHRELLLAIDATGNEWSVYRSREAVVRAIEEVRARSASVADGHWVNEQYARGSNFIHV